MKRMLLLTGLLLFSVCILGQNSDIVTTTLQGDGYTYVKRYKHALVELYNSENSYVDVPLVYKSTGERPPFDLREQRVEEDGWSHDMTMSIINGAFSRDQKLLVSDRKLGIAIYINSTTGRISDVRFVFLERGPFSKIPLSVFREIEVKLKEEVYFTLTEAGRNVNYVFFFWNHEVK